MKLLRIDENGFFIEDVIVKEIPMIEVDGKMVQDPQYIQTLCQGGFYHPKWNGSEWVEGLSQTEIDAIINQPKPITEQERLEALEQGLLEVILNG